MYLSSLMGAEMFLLNPGKDKQQYTLVTYGFK